MKPSHSRQRPRPIIAATTVTIQKIGFAGRKNCCLRSRCSPCVEWTPRPLLRLCLPRLTCHAIRRATRRTIDNLSFQADLSIHRSATQIGLERKEFQRRFIHPPIHPILHVARSIPPSISLHAFILQLGQGKPDRFGRRLHGVR